MPLQLYPIFKYFYQYLQPLFFCKSLFFCNFHIFFFNFHSIHTELTGTYGS